MKLLRAILVSVPLAWAAPALAQSPATVKLCIPTSPTACVPVTASAPLPITGSFSATLAGFTPNGNYTTLTATAASSASTALPAGTVVAFQNLSSVDVSCVLTAGASTATTNKLIVRAGATVYYTVGSNTTTACINQTGVASNVVGLAGGAGLGTAFGGASSGGGGGGAVTMASGAVASGAYASGSIASGAYASGSIGSGAMVDLGAIADAAATAGSTGSVNAKLRLVTTQLATINTTLGTPFQAGGAVTGTGASGAALSGNPFRVALSDGTNTQNWLAAIALADGVNGNNTGAVASWFWNGTTYDRATGTAALGAHVQVKSGGFASGSVASGAIASGAIASGAVASGAYASGSIASGAFASGSIGSGAMVDLGSQADAACGTATGTCSLIALQKYNNSATNSSVPAGTNLIGDVNLRQGGTALSATNGIYSNLLQGNAVISATNGIYANQLQGNAVLSATNPSFSRPTDGTNARVFDPCEVVAHVKTPINISTAATSVIVAGTASKLTHICSMMLFSAGTTNVGIVQGSGTTCGTSTLGLIGGTTSGTGPNLTAQAGFVAGSGQFAIAGTTVNANDICLINSQAIQVSGYIVTATP